MVLKTLEKALEYGQKKHNRVAIVRLLDKAQQDAEFLLKQIMPKELHDLQVLIQAIANVRRSMGDPWKDAQWDETRWFKALVNQAKKINFDELNARKREVE